MRDPLKERLDEAFGFEITDESRRSIAQLSDDARATAQAAPTLRSRIGGRAVVALGVLGLLGAGAATAAVAAPAIFDWLSFTPDASTTIVYDESITCEVGFVVHPDFANNRNPEEAVAIAQEYLRTLDLDSLPLEEQLAADEKDAENPANIPGLLDIAPEGLAAAKVSRALSQLIMDGVYVDLAKHGHTAGVSLEGGVNCADGIADGTPE